MKDNSTQITDMARCMYARRIQAHSTGMHGISLLPFCMTGLVTS